MADIHQYTTKNKVWYSVVDYAIPYLRVLKKRDYLNGYNVRVWVNVLNVWHPPQASV